MAAWDKSDCEQVMALREGLFRTWTRGAAEVDRLVERLRSTRAMQAAAVGPATQRSQWDADTAPFAKRREQHTVLTQLQHTATATSAADKLTSDGRCETQIRPGCSGSWSVERAHRSRDEARQDSVPARSICFFCLLVYRPCVCTARLRPATCDLRSRLPCLVCRRPLSLPGPALPACAVALLASPSQEGRPRPFPGLPLPAPAYLTVRARAQARTAGPARQPDWLPSRLRSLTSSPGLEQIAALARCISPFARTNKARPPLSPCRNWPAIRTVSDLPARTRKKKGLRQGGKSRQGAWNFLLPYNRTNPKTPRPQYAPPMMMMMTMMSGAAMIKHDDDDAPARPPARPALRKTPFRSVKHKNISQANLPTSCSAPTVTPRPPVGQKKKIA